MSRLHRIALTTILATTACSHAEIGEGDLGPEPRAAALEDHATPRSEIEAVYMLKQLGPDQYAVDLSGAMSELQSGASFLGRAEPAKKATVRTITGRVTDVDGRPVAGAVLLAGERVSCILGESLTAAHGTTTDGEGRFTLPLTTGEPLKLVAMANENAWSVLHDVDPGEDDLQLDVGLGEPAHVAGTLDRAGEPVPPVAFVRDREDDPLFMVRFQGEPDGSYESPPLPPGEYFVGYAVDDGKLLAAGFVEDRRVSLRAGTSTTHDVSFAAGTALTLGFEGLEEDTLRTVTYTILAGGHDPASPEDLDALREAGKAEVLAMILVGGIDLRPPREFPDIPAGEVTACLEARGMNDADEIGRAKVLMAFECRTIALDPADAAREIAFSL